VEKKLREEANISLRFEYAWRWFEFHAKQRVSMFNFFLVGIGILANAYVLLILQNLKYVAGTLAIIGALISLIFVFLDRRNRQLVKIGERLLNELEGNGLFSNMNENTQNNLGPFHQEITKGEPPFYLKHWFLIEGLQTITCLSFIFGAIFAFFIK
jgi:hypothetical protein